MTGPRIVALAGGVGGARLLHGLDQIVDDLTAIVNTGDDFTHWGLSVCPDLDTCMYTLAGLADMAQGWGLADESFRLMEMVQRYGGDAWFRLGDRDMATHVLRSQWRREGVGLAEVTRRLSTALGVRARLLPMTEAPRPTIVLTDDGPLPFQEWLVRRRAPPVCGVRFEGPSAPGPGVLAALQRADLVVICPSNPYVSIDPILSLDGVLDALQEQTVVAVSPIVGGVAVKGPLAEMIPRIAGRPPSAAAIADHYPFLAGIVVETGDRVRLPSLATATVMGGAPDRARLAREVLAFARGLR